jgi:O-antigen ligase/tetratricopeptide (TPR) repeat protein
VEGSSRRRKKAAQRTKVEARPFPILGEAPFLLALALAPLVAGYQDPLPPLLLGCLVWAAVLLRLFLPGGPPLPRPSLWWLAALFPLLAGCSLVVSVNRGGTVVQTVLYASYAGAWWLAAGIAARGGAGRLLGAVLMGALIAAGLGLQEYLINAREGSPSWRAFGTFSNPNFFAGYLVPALLLALGLALYRPEAFKPSTWMLVLALTAGALASALMVTGSRGGLLSLGVGLVTLAGLAAWRRELRGRETWTRLAVLAALLAVIAAVFSSTIRARGPADRTGESSAVPGELCPEARASDTGESTRFRRLTWEATGKMALKRPFLGWGAGSFEAAFGPHAIAGYTRHAHSSYLQFFAEEGLPAVLLWCGLLLAAGIALLKLPRRGTVAGESPEEMSQPEPEALWASGAGAALAAGAAHNLFDSLVFVPAIGLLTWTLLGTAIGGLSQRGSPNPQSAIRNPQSRLRNPQWLLAALALIVSAVLVSGRALLQEGRGAVRTDPVRAVESLNAARTLLPWDYQVADAQRVAYARLERREEAVEAARRAVRLAPYRLAGYAFLGDLHQSMGSLPAAQESHEQGLEISPQDVRLLYARAGVLQEQGKRGEALETYRRMLEVEKSPIVQVPALGEIRDYRFARARMALAAASEAKGDSQQAFEYRKAAACALAERRQLFDRNPAGYVAVGDFDPDTEAELRAEEQRLWQALAQDYRRQGRNHLADLSAEQGQAVEKSWQKLEKLLREFEGLQGG